MSTGTYRDEGVGLDVFSLKGRVALVTGAAGGMGEAISRQLGQMGAHVVLADISDGVNAMAATLAAEGLATEALQFDVTSSAAVDALAEAVVQRHGRVDIAIANAGMSYDVATEDHTDEQWRRVMAINLDGVFYTIRAFGRQMLAQGSGAIVAISSISGVKHVRPEKHLGYDATKAAVAHMCKVTGCEWAARGVRVNAVGPGYTNTRMLREVGMSQPEVLAQWLGDTPMRRLMEPKEIARTIGFLVSDAASGITGQLVMVDGGYSVS